MAGVGPREIVILRGRGSVWCRSVVCGMSFCVAGAVFGTLLYTLHAPHFTCPTLYTLHFWPSFILYLVWELECIFWPGLRGSSFPAWSQHRLYDAAFALAGTWPVFLFFSPTVSHSVFFFSRQMNVFG